MVVGVLNAPLLLNLNELYTFSCVFAVNFDYIYSDRYLVIPWPKFHVYQISIEAAIRGVLIKWCSENMQQIYRRTPVPRCCFKVALPFYWNHFLAWMFSCKFAAYFQNTFSSEHLWRATSGYCALGSWTGLFVCKIWF